MTTTRNTRYIDAPRAQVCATLLTAAQTVPEQWRAFQELAPLPGQLGDVTYGAVYASDPAAGTFEYLRAAICPHARTPPETS